MNNNIICHIVGLDEINKQKLLESIPKHIIVIDLDVIQQKIYNDADLTTKKRLWEQISKNINLIKKKNNIVKSLHVLTWISYKS